MQARIERIALKLLQHLKHLSNFWRTLNIPLVYCKLSLTLNWFESCVKTIEHTDKNLLIPVLTKILNFLELIIKMYICTFQIRDAKLYVPVVTLSTEDDNKLLEQLKSRFKRTIKWNKYRSEVTKQTKSNNFNYLIGPTFNKVNRLFVLSFENEDGRKYFLSIIHQKSK